MLEKLQPLGTLEVLSEYKCKVVLFQESHLILGIRIHHPDIDFSTRYLNFLAVYYFEGPIFWTGANFTKAEAGVGNKILKSLFPNEPDRRFDYIANHLCHVCNVQNANTTVNIVYGDMSVSKEPPVHRTQYPQN